MMNALQNGSRFSLFPVGQLAQEMNHFFDNTKRSQASHNDTVFRSPTSIWEDDSTVYFEFDLPGISIDAIDVKIADNHLLLTAERPVPVDHEFVHQERAFGRFERMFKLHSKIDEDSIEATLDQGVLRVTMSKAPEARVKKIEVKTTS